ncbi:MULTISPECIES: DUF1292 domain-containing protein [Peptoniphilus]|uniref:DUF1292 domain-containing protein n=1 Tax=Peptoniphilus TaxID=162289 RepID=UPI0001DA9C98|nr:MULTISPECIES: DUF1292 domain-containing protein [Peptoniphilus]EFI42440.1 hypothetical protein HMPREF0629_01090 [Peptoniphilus sp. oral taxon 386 str. F0131]
MERHLFYDENNEPVEFIVKAKFTVDDTDYVAMLPADDLEPLIYILKIEVDDAGNEFLVGIEDEELEEATAVYEELMKDKLQ